MCKKNYEFRLFIVKSTKKTYLYPLREKLIVSGKEGVRTNSEDCHINLNKSGSVDLKKIRTFKLTPRWRFLLPLVENMLM